MEAVLQIGANRRGDLTTRLGTVWERLKPGVSQAQADAEVDVVARQIARTGSPDDRFLTGHTRASLTEQAQTGIQLTRIGVSIPGHPFGGGVRQCGGRSAFDEPRQRRHETAIRQALGASRARLIREWMVESVVLSSLAAALGIAGASALMNALPGLVPTALIPIPLHFDFSFGFRVWIYAASLVIVSALFFGLVPAWRGSRPDLLGGLRRDSAVSILRVRIPIRSLLIVMQVAAAEALLFSAGLALDAVSTVGRIDVGFDPHRPIALATLLPTAEDGSLRQFDCEAIREKLAESPGVRHVAYGRSVPLSLGNGPNLKMEIPGQEPRDIFGGLGRTGVSLDPWRAHSLGPRSGGLRSTCGCDRCHPGAPARSFRPSRRAGDPPQWRNPPDSGRFSGYALEHSI